MTAISQCRGRIAAVAISFWLAGCTTGSKNGADQPSSDKRPTGTPSSQTNQTPNRSIPKDSIPPAQPSKPCKDWDFSANSDMQAIVSDGFKIRIDCSTLSIAASESSVASMFQNIHSSLPEIKNLASRPHTIVLSGYSRRALGNHTWQLSILVETKEELYNFIAAEKLFQPIEQKLFSGKAFLQNAANEGERTVPIDPAEFEKATAALEYIAPVLSKAVANDQIKIVSLPLSVYESGNLAYLKYVVSDQTRFLRIPYNSNLEGISHYISTVVPSVHRLSLKSGAGVNFTALSVALFDSIQQGQDASAETFKERCDYLARVFDGLANFADKFKKVISKANKRFVMLRVATRTLRGRYSHGFEPTALGIYSLEDTGDLARNSFALPNFEELGTCLDKLMVDPQSTPEECVAKFKE